MLSLLLFACTQPGGKPDTFPTDTTDSGPADSGDPDTAPPDDTGRDTSDPAATCAPDHTRLDMTPTVIDADQVADWSYLSWQLDLWLSLNGLGWLTPTRYDVSTWRIRYTTQDRGVETEATALVSVPLVSAEAEIGTVLWTHPTAGFEDMCAPSTGAVENLAPPIVSAARGYIAVAPDYLGLNGIGDDAADPHPWIVGEPTAIASLDALRAVEAWLPTSGLHARVDRSRIVYWGWSEGGYAALITDRYAPTHAPDHTPIGVIAAVPPVDIAGQVRAGLDSLTPATRAGALILYQHSVWHDEPGLEAAVQADVLAALPGELAASCGSWPSVDGATAVSEIYTDEFVATASAGGDFDPWTCLLERSSLPTPGVPYTGSAPVLLVTAAADDLVPEAPVLAAIPALCDEGYTVEHISCAGAAHGEAPIFTLAEQLDWMDARMAGEPAAAGCGVSAPVTCE
jgi:dienelactone hydrolase